MLYRLFSCVAWVVLWFSFFGVLGFLFLLVFFFSLYLKI